MPSASTPVIPNETVPVRFRDRVRARIGTAELFVFRVGDEVFACDVRAVEEVVEAPVLYPLPAADPAMAGVCQYAGRSLAVVRATALLGVDGGQGGTVLVMRRGNEQLGLLVDDVDEVCSIELSALRQPPWDGDDLLLAVHWDGTTLLAVVDARAMVTAAAAAIARGGR
ncbi:MAG: chemotaxis protein CheW [Gemmatimonadaceae bacterium]|nr:chemotaxis protein CheW [Gemmatimonadaceae bacterium]